MNIITFCNDLNIFIDRPIHIGPAHDDFIRSYMKYGRETRNDHVRHGRSLMQVERDIIFGKLIELVFHLLAPNLFSLPSLEKNKVHDLGWDILSKKLFIGRRINQKEFSSYKFDVKGIIEGRSEIRMPSSGGCKDETGDTVWYVFFKYHMSPNPVAFGEHNVSDWYGTAKMFAFAHEHEIYGSAEHGCLMQSKILDSGEKKWFVSVEDMINQTKIKLNYGKENV